MANADYQVEFREAITTAIPSLFQRLTDKDEDVRLETVKVVGKLANHGKSWLDFIMAQLIQLRS
jgi:HEAT repeat protein